MLKSLFACFNKNDWRNPIWNTRVYDGMTRNDFKKGTLIEFLYKIEIISQPYNHESDLDGRGYWIGWQNDD